MGRKERRANDGDRVEHMERRNTKDLTTDRDEETALGELAPQADVIRRKREHPMQMGSAPRQFDVCLIDYSRRSL